MAAFAEVSYDITPDLTLTGGMRLYDYINTLKGFFGFSAGFSSHTGESQCFGPGQFHNAPCTDLDQSAVGTGNTHKINLSYKIDDKRMVYFTWSTGFRPGGINRRTDDAGPYAPDKLTNYEVGWKTQWLGDTLRINGALFREDWDNVQFPFLGANSFTIIQNAGNATSQGIETDFEWRPIPSLTFSGSGAVTDANLTSDYCGFNNPVTKQPYTSNCLANDGFPPEAPAGTQLPITPKWKGNLTSRYDFPVAGFAGHVQGSVQAQSSAWDDLRISGAYPPFAPSLAGALALHARQTVRLGLVRFLGGHRQRLLVGGALRAERLRRTGAAISLRRMRDAGLRSADLCRATTAAADRHQVRAEVLKRASYLPLAGRSTRAA